MTNLEKLKMAFVNGLVVEEAELDFPSLRYRGIEEWDSVAHMQIVAEIEDLFDIMLDTDDVIAMESFDVAKEIVEKYGVSVT